jgi:hypothetical protein
MLIIEAVDLHPPCIERIGKEPNETGELGKV